MTHHTTNPLHSLLQHDAVRSAAAALLDAVDLANRDLGLSAEQYAAALSEFESLRGQPLAFPILTGGAGDGARVKLADGRVKLDFVSGIGVHAFGHGDRDLRAHALVAAASDTWFQGHLNPGPESLRLAHALLRSAGPRLAHAWLAVSGTLANENALKMIYQKHAPADRIVAFENAFHGRSLTMSELSDRPGYRVGLPQTDRVLRVPFYDPQDGASTAKSVAALAAHLQRWPGRIAGMCFELVQGEGGFNTAPTRFFAALMARCKAAGLTVWVDEVQTFGRTGELFAFRTLGLEEWVQVVTVGKLIQGSATLCTHDLNPAPGLLGGTFAGNTVGMAVGARILERLEQEGYLGPEGRLTGLAHRIEARFQALAQRLPGAITARSGLGAMQAFVPWEGSAAVAKALLDACLEEGLLLLQAGSAPVRIRLLPPLNTTDEELDAAFAMLERAMRRVAADREAAE